MIKNDCRVGMLVEMLPEGIRAVVIKVNPKRAKVKTIDVMQGRGRGGDPGSTWSCPYSMLRPLVGEKATVVMKSYEQPDNPGIKTFMNREALAEMDVGDLEPHEEHIMRAICMVYDLLDDQSRNDGYKLHSKINSLFTALGREVSKDAAEKWLRKNHIADSLVK